MISNRNAVKTNLHNWRSHNENESALLSCITEVSNSITGVSQTYKAARQHAKYSPTFQPVCLLHAAVLVEEIGATG